MSKLTWAIIAIVIIIIAIIVFVKAKAKPGTTAGTPESSYWKMEATAPVVSTNPWKGYYGTT